MAIEIAEAVVGALKGELAATAVNAPMVPAEVSAQKLHLSLLLVTVVYCIPLDHYYISG